ncbi:Uncharacterised protein [Chlamydia abortus]|nr:Uncharacterised protein [Chlamydia abortus]
MARKLKIMENEKLPIDDLKNDKLKKVDNLDVSIVGRGIWQEN